MNIRVLPPADAQQQARIVYGRTYTASPGAYIDAPQGDALVLGANGWFIIAPVGTTAARPVLFPGGTIIQPGERFLDTTLGALLVYDGQVWRNQVTGAVV